MPEIYPTWKKFCEINLQYNSIARQSLWRNVCKNILRKKFQISTLCLTHFGKTFVKATFLLKKSLKRWFDEIFFRWEYIFHFTTLCTRLNSAEEIRFEEFYVQSVITINWWNPRRIFWRFSINIQSISRKNYQSKPQNSPKSKILLQNFVKMTIS